MVSQQDAYDSWARKQEEKGRRMPAPNNPQLTHFRDQAEAAENNEVAEARLVAISSLAHEIEDAIIANPDKMPYVITNLCGVVINTISKLEEKK